jgi:hypothetical protein
MSDDTMNADIAAVMVVLGAIIEALDTQQPGVKQALADSIQAAAQDMPDQDSPLKETLQKFHNFITRDNLMGMPFH